MSTQLLLRPSVRTVNYNTFMKTPTPKVSTISDYIRLFPKDVAVRLQTIRDIVKKAAPAAQEVISYRMPAFKLNGILIYFAAYEHHIGIYPYPSGIKKFQKELSAYKTSTSTIQLPHDKPLPVALLRKVIAFRVKEKMEKSKGK